MTGAVGAGGSRQQWLSARSPPPARGWHAAGRGLPSGRCLTRGRSASQSRWCRRPGPSASWPWRRESAGDAEGLVPGEGPRLAAPGPHHPKAVTSAPDSPPRPCPFLTPILCPGPQGGSTGGRARRPAAPKCRPGLGERPGRAFWLSAVGPQSGPCPLLHPGPPGLLS